MSCFGNKRDKYNKVSGEDYNDECDGAVAACPNVNTQNEMSKKKKKKKKSKKGKNIPGKAVKINELSDQKLEKDNGQNNQSISSCSKDRRVQGQTNYRNDQQIVGKSSSNNIGLNRPGKEPFDSGSKKNGQSSSCGHPNWQGQTLSPNIEQNVQSPGASYSMRPNIQGRIPSNNVRQNAQGQSGSYNNNGQNWQTHSSNYTADQVDQNPLLQYNTNQKVQSQKPSSQNDCHFPNQHLSQPNQPGQGSFNHKSNQNESLSTKYDKTNPEVGYVDEFLNDGKPTNYPHVDPRFDVVDGHKRDSSEKCRMINVLANGKTAKDFSRQTDSKLLWAKQSEKESADGIRNKTYCNKSYSIDHVEATKPEIVSVSVKYDIQSYVDREWIGQTPKSKAIREGYKCIEPLTQLSHIRRIRGDNYCAVRATVFQILSQSIPIVSYIGNITSSYQKNHMFYDKNYSYLTRWNFAKRLFNKDIKKTADQCFTRFYEKLNQYRKIRDPVEREQIVANEMNADVDLDIHLMEAVKLLMMFSAIQLYEDYSKGADVPEFVWLLFARDTSENPEKLMLNHLNPVGDSGGLEQIEMFLLAYALGIKISVVRACQAGHEDFIIHYPQTGGEHLPNITLIAEDDRHYNVLV